ncbi:MAG: ERAP1-like C-terminal domain-containing protein [Planctomycetes bacterium]|nr:ERAP1-like C-terminal domain-containing protein [Planctomycetota bacterium]
MLLAPLLLVSLVTTLPPQDPAPGISRQLAAQRKAQLQNVEYDLRFTLAEHGREVRGELRLRFELDPDNDPGADVVLDFAGETIDSLNANANELVPRRVADHLILPAATLVRGLNGVHATFTSQVAPTGTPLTVYHDDSDDLDYYYTLLVPADAHGLFPCFDQPDLRAKFLLELDLPERWTAIANGAPVDPDPDEFHPREDVVGKLWRFARTRPLPTYLFAFACGPFAEFTPPQPSVPGITVTQPMRVLLRSSRLPDLDREALVRLHHDGLAWLCRAFDVPYPFDKLDLALLPGFPYGGMEHAGAIFYRETSLLFDHPPTAGEQVARSTLVYHELSHQWFGNLVTMKWFDDLWLKEGFATFYGYRALAALEPERGAWLRFLQGVKPRAYAVDATPGTTPVFQELQNLADAKSAYGAIVYNKAPAVLRALFEGLGEKAFQAGVRRFLTTHAFDNADWRDLAAALQAAAGVDLDRWSDRWLLAPSMPQVRVGWTTDETGAVLTATLTQRPVGGAGSWPLDLELLVFRADGERRTLTVHSDAPETSLEALVAGPPPLAILANPRDVAYGQFVPDPTTAAFLLEHVAGFDDPLLRACATSALYEAVREAELDPARLCACLLDQLAAERDADTHGWLLARLGTCLSRYLPEQRAAPLRARATALLLAQLRDEAGSGRELGTFRFLAHLGGDAGVLDLCRRVIADHELPAGLTPGRRDVFLAVAALLAAAADDAEQQLAAAKARYRDTDIEKELFLAGAAVPTADNKRDYFARYLVADHPPEQWTQDSLGWFHWAGQEALTLPFLKPALEQVDWVKQHRRIFFMPAWLDAFVNGHDSPEALAIVDAFLAEHELSDDVQKKVLQSRDGLARAVRVRAAFANAGR